MRNVVISLAIGVGALLSSGANAAPLSVSPSMAPDTTSKMCDWSATSLAAATVLAVASASSSNAGTATATIMPRANVISNGADMMAATTTTGRASVSASVQAAWASALA